MGGGGGGAATEGGLFETRGLFKGNLEYTLLKPKRHSLRCHGFMVHA